MDSLMTNPKNKEELDELYRALEQTSSYRAMAKHRYPIKPVYYQFQGIKRPVKVLAFRVNEQCIPITKKKIREQLGSKGGVDKRSKALAALRKEVKPQILEFRKQYRKQAQLGLIKNAEYCPISGRLLSSGMTHVDHIIPFIKLADTWLLSYTDYTLFEELPLKGSRLEPYLGLSWAKFHRRFAQLQLTSGSGNVKESSRGYKSKC